MSKYELIEINGRQLAVDVSMLTKAGKLFFNATPMAKQYNKRPDDFWKQEQNRAYLKALVTLSQGNEADYVYAKRGGKYQGTWLHKDLALQFARWLDPFFAVKLDQWIVARLGQEHDRKRNRLESKTGFLPLTDAITSNHETPKPYHYSTECDMINRIVLGMSAKQYREKYKVINVRDNLSPDELAMIAHLQRIDTGLNAIKMTYADRKAHLEKCFIEGIERLPKLRQLEAA